MINNKRMNRNASIAIGVIGGILVFSIMFVVALKLVKKERFTSISSNAFLQPHFRQRCPKRFRFIVNDKCCGKACRTATTTASDFPSLVEQAKQEAMMKLNSCLEMLKEKLVRLYNTRRCPPPCISKGQYDIKLDYDPSDISITHDDYCVHACIKLKGVISWKCF